MKHFTINELTHTGTGLPNVPNNEQLKNLVALVDNILDPLREKFGHPITISSAFRSNAVNIKVKGAATSQHLKGQAADLKCSDNAKLFDIIRKELPFDQLIWEAGDDTQPSWVHVSFNAGHNRGEVLKMKNGKYTRL